MTRISKTDYERIKKGLDPIPLEDVEAEWFATWLSRDLEFKFFSHVSNETWTPSHNQKRKNTALWVKSGVPDYIIILPKWFTWLKKNKLIFIEMKRTQGGSVSPTQKLWLEALNESEGVEAFVCKGFEAAKEVIKSFASPKVKVLFEKR